MRHSNQRKRASLILGVMALAAGSVVLHGCNNGDDNGGPSTPTPSPSATTNGTPSATATTNGTPSATATTNGTPSATATTNGTVSPGPTAQAG